VNRRQFIEGGIGLTAAGAIPRVAAQSKPEDSMMTRTSIHRIEADGLKVFYREAGASDRPVVLLLHGFPTSSFQFRELFRGSPIVTGSSLTTCRDSALPKFPTGVTTGILSTRSRRRCWRLSTR